MSAGVAITAPDGLINLNDDAGPLIIAVSATMMSLSIVFVGLRYLSRRLIRLPWAIDDTVVLITLLFVVASTANNIWGAIRNGWGRHTILMMNSIDHVHEFLIGLYVFAITYTISIAMAKFCMLALYRRVFSSSRRFSQALLAVAVINGVWLVVVIFLAVFACSPVDGFWLFEKPSVCINTPAYFISGASTNIAIDFVIQLLPLFMIRSLNMSRSQKIAVSGIFLLSIVVPIVSFFRLYALLRASAVNMIRIDPTYALVGSGVWSVIEINLATVVACLPSMRPLLRFALHGTVRDSAAAKKAAANVPRTRTGGDKSFGIRSHRVGGSSKSVELSAMESRTDGATEPLRLGNSSEVQANNRQMQMPGVGAHRPRFRDVLSWRYLVPAKARLSSVEIRSGVGEKGERIEDEEEFEYGYDHGDGYGQGDENEESTELGYRRARDERAELERWA